MLRLLRECVKLIVLLASSCIMGLVFGVVPCYLFPLFGANVRDWCGYKSEPPHFFIQFAAGFLLMGALAAYLLYFRKRKVSER